MACAFKVASMGFGARQAFQSNRASSASRSRVSSARGPREQRNAARVRQREGNESVIATDTARGIFAGQSLFLVHALDGFVEEDHVVIK